MKRVLLFILFFVFVFHVSAQLAGWNFNNNSLDASSEAAGISASAAVAGSDLTLTGGDGVDANGRFSTSNWVNPGTNDYIEFTITKSGSDNFNVSAFNFSSSASGTGPTFLSANVLGVIGGSGSIAISPNSVGNNHTIDLSGLVYSDIGSITIRIIGTGASQNAGTFRIDDVSFTGSVLPVELLHFTASEEGKYNKLTWATAAEINNDYFSVEYSRDGHGYKEVGRVKGAGNAVETEEYSYLHEVNHPGLHYYRLLQVDFDGAFEYSHVVVVERKGEANISIHPNTIRGELQLFFNEGKKKDTRVIIYDAIGSKVMDGMIPANTTKQVFELSHLPAGYYFLRLQDKLATKPLRFLKVE